MKYNQFFLLFDLIYNLKIRHTISHLQDSNPNPSGTQMILYYNQASMELLEKTPLQQLYNIVTPITSELCTS